MGMFFKILVPVVITIFTFVSLYALSRYYFFAHFSTRVNSRDVIDKEDPLRAFKYDYKYDSRLRLPHTYTNGFSCHETEVGYKHIHQTKKCGLSCYR